MALIVAVMIASAIAIFFNKKIEETIVIAIFSVITFIYFSGLVTNFLPGIVVSVAVAIICGVYTTFRCVKDKTLVKANLLTGGFFIFLTLAAYFLIVSHNRYFNEGTDESHHWALVIKYFYMLNDYSNVPQTSNASYYHCPAVGLWDYFSTKFWVSCSTGMMMWGQQLFALSLLLPVAKRIKSLKQYKKNIILVLFCLVVPYCLRDVTVKFVGYTTFQPDFIQYLLMAFGILAFREYYNKDDKFYLFSSYFALFIMVLSKRTGIITAFAYMFVIFATLLMDGSKTKKEKWSITFSNLGIMLFAFLSWDIYLRVSGEDSSEITAILISVIGVLLSHGVGVLLGAIFALAIVVYAVVKLQDRYPKFIIAMIVAAFSAACLIMVRVKCEDQELKHSAILFVLHSLFGYDVHGYEMSMKMDTMQIGYGLRLPICLFLIIVFLIWRYIIHRDSESYTSIRFDGDLIVFSIVGYFMMQIFRFMGAVTSMAYKNQPQLAVADNYLGPYLIALIVILFDLWMEKQENVEDVSGKNFGILLVAAFIFFDCSVIFTSLVDKPTQHYFYALDGFSFEFGDKVYLMDTNVEAQDLGPDFLYQAAPAKTKSGTWYKDGYNGEKKTVSEVADALTDGGFNYVYIENLGPDFKDYYADLFEEPEDMDNNHIYRVNEVNGVVKLSLVR